MFVWKEFLTNLFAWWHNHQICTNQTLTLLHNLLHTSSPNFLQTTHSCKYICWLLQDSNRLHSEYSIFAQMLHYRNPRGWIVTYEGLHRVPLFIATPWLNTTCCLFSESHSQSQLVKIMHRSQQCCYQCASMFIINFTWV